MFDSIHSPNFYLIFFTLESESGYYKKKTTPLYFNVKGGCRKIKIIHNLIAMPGLGKRPFMVSQEGPSSSTKYKRQKPSTKTRVPRSIVAASTHKHIRTASTFASNYAIGVDLRDGLVWNGSSSGVFDCELNFTLNGVKTYLGGTLYATMAMPGVSELQSLYDQYRIDWVEVKIFFSANNALNTQPAHCFPIVYITNDYDDSNAVTVQDVQQYSRHKIWQLGDSPSRPFVQRVKPSVANSVFNTTVSTGYTRITSPLVDIASADVPHYGVKFAIDPVRTPTSSTLIGYISLACTYHLTMKNTR